MNRKKSSSKKSGQELNGNNQSGSSYKVENLRYKSRKNRFKSEDQSQNRLTEVHGNYLHCNGQRLYPALSEPAVCGGYPVSMAFPYEHVPIYSMYQPPPYLHRVHCKDSYNPPQRQRLRNGENQDKVDNSKNTSQTLDEYTSLPPGNLQDIESDHQRRFSDPGLVNNSGTEEDIDSLSNDKTSSESWLDDTSQLASQIESLVQENKRISKELKETQTELQELKLELSSMAHMRPSCEPGFIADLVREVREATKVKEETLLAKFNAYSDNLKTSSASTVDSRKECSKECEKTKGLLTNITLEKEEMSKRLARLEEQMKVILAHNSTHDSTKDKLLESEKENLSLQQKLRSAVEAKVVAESNTNKYERLFSSMTKRLPNGLSLEEKGPSLETSESLSSDLSSVSSMHSPQVTMSGPVTDL